MFSCKCCSEPKTYKNLKSLYKHERKYDPDYIDPCERERAEYNSAPKTCENCSKVIDFDKRRNRFCSQKCSGTANVRGQKNKGNSRRQEQKICLHCNNPRSSKTSKYCGLKCQQSYQWEAFKKADTSWTSGRRKRWLLEKFGHYCSKCGNSDWMGQPIELEIEHINGNSDDHSADNTTLLCPNCHAQTPTYKNRNIGSGRAARRRRYADGKSW